MMIKVKNAYELPEKEDGCRILAERSWPKAMIKNHEAVDEWAQELSPSLELETWYSYDPDLWEGFQRKYLNELKHSKKAINFVDRHKGTSTLTLLFTTTHNTNNPALVLKQFLEHQFEASSN